MEPYKAKMLPQEYKLDKELLKLLAEANEKYGEYKSLLNTLEFDSKFFLDSVLLNESFKSTQIEGTQISQDEMYYLKYLEKTDDNLEIQNLKKTIEFAYDELDAGIFAEARKDADKLLGITDHAKQKNFLRSFNQFIFEISLFKVFTI